MIVHLNPDFRPVIRYLKELPEYYCNRKADVFSTKTGKFLKPKLKWSARLREAGRRLRCYSYILSIPTGLFEDYDHRARGKKHSPAISIDAHRIVAETWKPIDEYPPDELKETWDQVITPDMVGQKRIPEEWKAWVRSSAYIDHIDDNPANNHVDNLRWVKPIENQSFRKAASKNA
jgi:hypothetical protein